MLVILLMVLLQIFFSIYKLYYNASIKFIDEFTRLPEHDSVLANLGLKFEKSS